MTAAGDGAYSNFRGTTLWELHCEPGVWEIFGDTLNFFPDADEETRAAHAEQLLRELWKEDFATFVRLPENVFGHEHGEPLTDDEVEDLILRGIWRDNPVPGEALLVILVPTQKALGWRENESRKGPHAPSS